jgi:hypothetical protein
VHDLCDDAGKDNNCIPDECDGGADFLDCYRSERTECGGRVGGPCRAEVVAFVCCIDACPDDDLDACVMANCASESTDWQTCVDDSNCASRGSILRQPHHEPVLVVRRRHQHSDRHPLEPL